ncbi:hypothetical protein K493DRAFT_352865 [Basidiobolus meristosporus CBS 931.73]|uniref:Cep57 centrosome microtubule-binding domain-containing protein n=1 Tax=Basidiobolus meristosporus CBS 931.73 TaxID=1314790 RepID=A0A1Y1Y7N3_9FUNG|nr:hypothetical protein K493DRAFT_352865 [Basidiobolus meristosporus CBS 931.73]|eukprot:ORX93988.1 hypothetical protein K493DRAFT_352865 [Basidiobolus meristosporus CBS 931.73]
MDFDSLKDIKLLLGRQGGDVLADIEREIALLTRPDLTPPSQVTGSTVFTDADEQERQRLEAELESDLEKLDISLATEDLTKEQSTTFQQIAATELDNYDLNSRGVNTSTHSHDGPGDMATSRGERMWNFEDASEKSVEDTSPERQINSLSEEKIKQLLDKINHFNFEEHVGMNNDSLSVHTDPGQRHIEVDQGELSHFSDDATIDLGPELNNLSFSLSQSGTYSHNSKADIHQSIPTSSARQHRPESNTPRPSATISREKLTSFEMNTNEEDSLRRKIEVLLGVSRDVTHSQEESRTSVRVGNRDDDGMGRIHEILSEELMESEPELSNEHLGNSRVANLTDSSTNSRSFKSGSSFMKEIERQRELSRQSHKESDDDFNLDDLRELILQDEDALAEVYHSPDAGESDTPVEPRLHNQRSKAELSFNSVSSKPRIDFGSLLDFDSSHPSDKKSDSKSGFESSQSHPPNSRETSVDNEVHSGEKHSVYSMEEIDNEFEQDLRASASEMPTNITADPEANPVEPQLITSTPSRNYRTQSPQSISVSGISSYTDQLPPTSLSDPGQSHHQALVLETLQNLQKQIDQLQIEKMNGTREVEQLKNRLEKQRLRLKRYEKSRAHSHSSSVKGMTSSQIHDRELDKKKLQQLMAEKEHLHSIIDQLQTQNEELDKRNQLDKNLLSQNLIEARDEALEAIRKFEEQLSFKNKEIEAIKSAVKVKRSKNDKDVSVRSESAAGLSDIDHFRTEIQSERRKIVHDRKQRKESLSRLSHDNDSADSKKDALAEDGITSSDRLTHLSSSKLKRAPSDPFIRSDNNLFKKLYQSSKLGSEGNSLFRHSNQSHSKPSILSDTYRRQELDFFDHMTHRVNENRNPSQGYVEETPTRYKGKSSFSLLLNNSTLPPSKKRLQESDQAQASNTNTKAVDQDPKSVRGVSTSRSPNAHQATITSTPLGPETQPLYSNMPPAQKTHAHMNGNSKKDVGTQSSMVFSETIEEPRTKDACVQNSTFFEPKCRDFGNSPLDDGSEEENVPAMHHHSPMHEFKLGEGSPSPRMYYDANMVGRENPTSATKENHSTSVDNPAHTPQGNWKVIKNATPMSIAAQSKLPASNVHRNLPFIVGTNTGKSHSITVNLQKMFSALQKHSPTLCSVCQDRREHGNPGAISRNRIDDSRKNPRQARLERVIKTLEDEFLHLKIQYQKAVSLYEAIDLTKQPILREQKSDIAQQLNEILQAMEKKADQIINLRDLRETKATRKPAQAAPATPMNLKILRGSRLIQEILDS